MIVPSHPSVVFEFETFRVIVEGPTVYRVGVLPALTDEPVDDAVEG